MRFPIFASLLLATLLTLLTTPTSALTPKERCKHKSHAVAQAIARFCSKSNIVVPSTYAESGAVGGDKGSAYVQILGPCNPPQWVPKEFCMKQFHKICAEGDVLGAGRRHYGRNGCQEWTISR